MKIFQSEHVEKQKKCPGFIGKMAIESTRSQSTVLSPTNIAELKTALPSIWNDLPQEFINKTMVSFRKSLWSCVAAVGGHFRDFSTQFKTRGQLTCITELFELLTKKLCKV